MTLPNDKKPYMDHGSDIPALEKYFKQFSIAGIITDFHFGYPRCEE